MQHAPFFLTVIGFRLTLDNGEQKWVSDQGFQKSILIASKLINFLVQHRFHVVSSVRCGIPEPMMRMALVQLRSNVLLRIGIGTLSE